MCISEEDPPHSYENNFLIHNSGSHIHAHTHSQRQTHINTQKCQKNLLLCAPNNQHT